MSNKSNNPLIMNIPQYEVDFVIPRLGIDLPIGIDPFLIYKSRDANLQALHNLLINTFNYGIRLIEKGDLVKARDLFAFPEVAEIGLGYTRKSKRGAGLGSYLTELIIQTLIESPLILSRGVKHIEEMQLISIGIGADRISDIVANILKQHLIAYTQKQCKIWEIPLSKNVPVQHIFNPVSYTWFDGYFDLPTSPYDNSPIILVPRCLVRTLPWINYNDFLRSEFTTYLRSKRVKSNLTTKELPVPEIKNEEKQKIIEIARSQVERIDRYIAAKEASSSEAQPTTSYVEASNICPESESLKIRLSQIPPGTDHAVAYQKTVLAILNFLFNPELVDGELEIKTIDGTERRDIIFTNDSDQSFWSYLRNEHSSLLLMFETKNVTSVDNNHFNQTAVYLGDRLGRLGIIVTRNTLKEAQERKAFSIYNDSNPRKIILTLSDADLLQMLDMKCHGNDPMRHIQKLYRSFKTRVQ